MPRFALACLYAGLSFVHASQPCQGDGCNVMVNSLLQSSHRETKTVHSTKARDAPFTAMGTKGACRDSNGNGYDAIRMNGDSETAVTLEECKAGCLLYAATECRGIEHVGTNCNLRMEEGVTTSLGGWSTFWANGNGQGEVATAGGGNTDLQCYSRSTTFVCPSGWTRTAAFTPFELGTTEGNTEDDCGCKSGCSGYRCTNKCGDGGTGNKCPTVDQNFKLTESNAALYCTRNSMLQIEKQAPYWQMNAGSAACATGTAIQTKEECKKAFAALGLSSVVNWDGAHSGIPVGCSTASNGNINWNTATTGAAKDLVKPVCKTSSSSYWQMNAGSAGCATGTGIQTKEECKAAFAALGLSAAVNWDGAHSGIPVGCSTASNGNINWNTATTGAAKDLVKPVCKTSSSSALTQVTSKASQEWTTYSFGACYDSNGNQYDSYNKAGTWDDVEDCKAACKLFRADACRGVNWHSGNCKLRVDEGATSDDISSMTAAGWTKNWDAPAGGIGVPTYAANGNPDFKCYAREQVWTVYSFGACYDSNGNQYDSYDKAGTWDDVEDCKAACSLFGQKACRGVNWHSGNCKLRVDEDATSDDIASMTAEGWTKNWDAPTGGTGVPTYAAKGNPDFKCYARE